MLHFFVFSTFLTFSLNCCKTKVSKKSFGKLGSRRDPPALSCFVFSSTSQQSCALNALCATYLRKYASTKNTRQIQTTSILSLSQYHTSVGIITRQKKSSLHSPKRTIDGRNLWYIWFCLSPNSTRRDQIVSLARYHPILQPALQAWINLQWLKWVLINSQTQRNTQT